MGLKDRLKKITISEIIPYKNNAKIHDKVQIEQLKKSIKENDYYQPIGVDKNNVIVIGHGRYYAMREMDPAQKIDVIDLSYLPEEKIAKLRIADNKIISNKWDQAKLKTEIERLYSKIEPEKIYNDLAIRADDLEEIMDSCKISDEEFNSLIDPTQDRRDSENRNKDKRFIYKCENCGHEKWAK